VTQVPFIINKWVANQEVFMKDPKYDLDDRTDAKVRKLHYKLFPEEFDQMFDSNWDASDRKEGKNPKSSAYALRVNARRMHNGFPPLSDNGTASDNSGWIYCADLILSGKEVSEVPAFDDVPIDLICLDCDYQLTPEESLIHNSCPKCYGDLVVPENYIYVK